MRSLVFIALAIGTFSCATSDNPPPIAPIPPEVGFEGGVAMLPSVGTVSLNKIDRVARLTMTAKIPPGAYVFALADEGITCGSFDVNALEKIGTITAKSANSATYALDLPESVYEGDFNHLEGRALVFQDRAKKRTPSCAEIAIEPMIASR